MEDNDKVYLYTDGGSRGNPGPACAAYSIIAEDNETVLAGVSVYLGKATNNEAEYAALIFGLIECQRLAKDYIIHVSDSMLIVKQVNGEWKVKEAHLKAMVGKVRILISEFMGVSNSWVPRDHPGIKYVDSLLNERLDKELKSGTAHGNHSVRWKAVLGNKGRSEDDKTNFIEVRHHSAA